MTMQDWDGVWDEYTVRGNGTVWVADRYTAFCSRTCLLAPLVITYLVDLGNSLLTFDVGFIVSQ